MLEGGEALKMSAYLIERGTVSMYRMKTMMCVRCALKVLKHLGLIKIRPICPQA